MKIYVGHSSSIDFREELYEPLKSSDLFEEHELVFPHEDSGELFDSKNFLKDEADLMVAEVSEASTGLGIELGWADRFEVPIICICRESADPSGALKAVTDDLNFYADSQELIKILRERLESRF